MPNRGVNGASCKRGITSEGRRGCASRSIQHDRPHGGVPSEESGTPRAATAPRATLGRVGALDLRLEHGGLHFPSLGLWMDPHRPVGPGQLAVVTHAHADHIGDHAEVVLTEPTRRLMRSRLPGQRIEHVLGFQSPASLRNPPFHPPRDATLELLPAGHVLGSAMALLAAEGESVLYTGDFKLRHGRSAEACQPRQADVLVMETTFGRPRYVFPPVADVLRGILHFCHEAIDNDEVPVLLGYSLGKAQEILACLGEAGLPVMLAEPVARMTRIYEDLGRAFPPCQRLDAGRARGHVVIAPPGGNIPALRRRLGPSRVAVLTGWALDPGCRFRHHADAAFPLSDHADFGELLEMVRRVAPRRVLTLHGFAADFAAHLRGLGIEAWALAGTEQLELQLAHPSPPRPTPWPAPPHRVAHASPPTSTAGEDGTDPASTPSPSSLGAFAKACTDIRSRASKHAKVERLAEYLRHLPTPSLPHAVAWFSGRPFPGADPGGTSVGWSLLRQALCEASGCPVDAFNAAHVLHGDTAEAAADVWPPRSGEATRRPSLEDVMRTLQELSATTTRHDRGTVLAGFLRGCNAQEARHLVKILTGNLRIGLKEGLVEEAIALAFQGDPAAVRKASLVLGDLVEVARLAGSGQLHEAVLRPLRPVRVMLASAEPSAHDVSHRIASWPGGLQGGAWAEDKHDGIRCQAHVASGVARLFSRELKDVTASFPEVARALQSLGHDVILDGEIVAMDGDQPRPFQHLQRRLGRHAPDLFMGEECPARLVAFDLLWKDGQGLLDLPHGTRHRALRDLASATGLPIAHGIHVHDADAVQAAFDHARGRGHEGLVIKDPACPYLPGRRGLGWVKLKQAMPTLDCVVVGAEYGHGKRRGVLSDYTFALRDADTGQLRILGKAYSGLSNAEIAALTQRLLARVRKQSGRFHEVEPEVVLEIAFDQIQPSPRHDSGLALRFPRIVGIREDKGPMDCDTLQEARRLLRSSHRGGKAARTDATSSPS